MKLKAFLTLLAAGTLLASAQGQGYKDGIEYYKAGQYENAKTILLNTINEASTDKALANYYLGQVNLAKGEKGTALNYFNTGVAADAENPYNYVGLGALNLLEGNEKAAEENFDLAKKYGKKNHEITVNIARAYYNADPVKYAKEIDKLLQKAHKDSKNNEPTIYILEGDMHMKNKEYNEAAADYEMAIRFDNTNSEGYVKYANCYFYVNPEFSIKKLEEFLTVNPNSALAQRELAEKLYEARYWGRAADQYGRYIQNPNHFPEDKSRYAVLLYFGEKYAESFAVAQELYNAQPENFQAQRMMFLNKVKLNQFEEGAKYAESFFNNNPEGFFTANDYITYGTTLSQIGQDSVAIVQYIIATEKFPENAGVYSGLSEAYDKAGNNADSADVKAANYAKAAEAFELYLKNTKEVGLTDNMTASGRWLKAAATVNADDSVTRAAHAQKGIVYIDRVIAEAKPLPALFQRKANLHLFVNNFTPNAEVVDAYSKMIEILDQDPANLTNRNKALYQQGYQFIYKYYKEVAQDEAKAEEYLNKIKVLNGEPAATEVE